MSGSTCPTLALAFLMLVISGTSGQAQMSFIIEPGTVRLAQPDMEASYAGEADREEPKDSSGSVSGGLYSPGSWLSLTYKVRLDAPLGILAFENREAYDAHAEAYQNGMPSPVQLNYVFYLERKGGGLKNRQALPDKEEWRRRIPVIRRTRIDEHLPRGSFQDNDTPLERVEHRFQVPQKEGTYTLFYCQTHVFSLVKLSWPALAKRLQEKPAVLCGKKLARFQVGQVRHAYREDDLEK